MLSSAAMTTKTPEQQAMDFIALYEHPGADDYENHVVAIARTWRHILRADRGVQGLVNRLTDELNDPAPDHYGCGWQELREKFTSWAINEGWLNPDGSIPRKPSR